MNRNRRNWVSFFFVIAAFLFLVDMAIALDISVVRQILCFICLTLVPGIVLLTFFDLRNLDFTEKTLVSVGISLAFIIFLGLVVNQIGFLFPFLTVLSTPVLLLVLNSVILLLCIFGFLFHKCTICSKRSIGLSLTWLSSSIPILAIVGTMLVNLNGDNSILLVSIGVAALAILLTFTKVRKDYALILFMVTLAILFHTSLISNYLVGFDVHRAYYVFEITQINGKWNPTIAVTGPYAPRLNQMLSVTVLPTIYSNMLNLEGIWIFKIVFPLIFALIPVGLFQLYRKYIGRQAAFLAAFLVLADITFFAEMPGLPTQMIAEFFLVLSLIVIFHEKINPIQKLILFIVFGAGMIVSHYGTSYIFLFLLLIGWSISLFMKKPTKIKSTYVMLFFAMTFLWYIYTSQSASFTTLLEMGQNIYRSFWTEFLNPTEDILRGVGMGESAISMGHYIGRGFHYITQFLIVFGITAVGLKWKVHHKLDYAYVLVSALMLGFIIFPLILPSFSLLNITRMYHIALLFLAPFCIIGGDLVLSFLPRLWERYSPSILTLLVVVSLFLFETGFVYELSGDVSFSVPLSLYRIDRTLVYGRGYLTESVDVAAAQWLNLRVVVNPAIPTVIYADGVSIYCRLISYGVIRSDCTEVLSNVTYPSGPNTYAYLRNFNTFDGKVATTWGPWLNISDINPRLETLDRVYTNGGSEIFAAPGAISPQQ